VTTKWRRVKNPTMKVAVVGSHTLQPKEVVLHLRAALNTLPKGAQVLLRRGRTSPPGDFELLTQALCLNLHLDVEWCIPDEGGREAVFLRDVEMVRQADAVVAFFSPDLMMAGGTGHVVEKAMDADRAVYAYSVLDQHRVDWVGGNEPDDGIGHLPL